MPYSVELFLDPDASQKIAAQWESLVNAEVPTGLEETGYTPHVTLAVCEELDLEAFDKAFKAFGERVWFPTLTLSHLGLFPPPAGVLFLGLTPHDRLMDIQREFHHLFADYAESTWEYYHPGQWVPHCTLANELTPGQIPRAFSALASARMPIEAQVHAVAIVELPSRKVLRQVLQ